MKRHASCLLVGAILFLASRAATAVGWIVEGVVVGVSDGDTITILDDAKTQHKIRFAGIDAPEKGQAFGERSRQSLAR
jgi:endonuclease YncB( thermonuclease family)